MGLVTVSKSTEISWDNSSRFKQESESKQLAARGPCVWVCGCTLLVVTYCFAEGCMPQHLLPSFQSWMGWTAVLLIWTISCSLLLLFDAYHTIVKHFLGPAFEHLQRWSLDDVLRLCLDPQQFATHVIGFTTISASLYTIPTTPEQRTRVYQAMGVLPNDDHALDILAAPGGWMRLFRTAPLLNDTSSGVDDGSTTQETEQEPYCPYSISPIYRVQPSEQTNKNDTASTVKIEPAPSAFLNSRAEPQQLHEILGSILLQHAQHRLGWDNTTDTVLSPTTLRATAIAATLVLGAQLRYSATARSYCKTILHLLVTASSGSALCAAMIGLRMATTTHRPTVAPWSSLSLLQQVVRTPISTLMKGPNRMAWKGGLLVVVLMLLRKLRRRSPRGLQLEP